MSFLKTLTLITIAFACPSAMLAQQEASQSSADSIVTLSSKHAIGINFGTQGLGLDYAYRINPHFSARMRGMYTNFEIQDYPYTLDGQDINVNVALDLQHVGLIFDYYPSKNSSFKLMAGAAYFLQNNISLGIRIQDTLYIGDDGPDPDDKGDFVYYPDDIGGIDLGVTWNQIAPYVGLGFGRAVPKGRIGFALELGAYYTGAPQIESASYGLIEISKAEEAELQDNLAQFAWYPQMNFRLSIKL